MTPEQEQLFTLTQFLNRGQPGTVGPKTKLSYDEWLKARGGGNPYEKQLPQQPQGPDIGGLIKNISAGKGVESGITQGAGTEGLSTAGTTAADVGGTGSTGLNAGIAADMGPTPFYIPAAAVITTALAGKAGLDMLKGKSPSGPAGKFGRGSLAVASGGISEGVNKVGKMFGLGHKSTRDVAKGNTEKFQGVSPDDPIYQAYVRGMREQYNSAPTDPSKPFAGKYASWDEYKKAGLDANDLSGVAGNIEHGGADWAHLSQDQRRAITQANIDANNYDSRKGEVNIVDPGKFKSIMAAQLIDPGYSSSQNMGQAMNDVNSPTGFKGPLMIQQATTPQPMKRSKTLSPGIGLDGKRIKY